MINAVCRGCGYEIDGPAYCAKCFEALLAKIIELEKENKSLRRQVDEMRCQIEALKYEAGLRWARRRR